MVTVLLHSLTYSIEWCKCTTQGHWFHSYCHSPVNPLSLHILLCTDCKKLLDRKKSCSRCSARCMMYKGTTPGGVTSNYLGHIQIDPRWSHIKLSWSHSDWPRWSHNKLSWSHSDWFVHFYLLFVPKNCIHSSMLCLSWAYNVR